jgi:DNA gyrase subunit A
MADEPQSAPNTTDRPIEDEMRASYVNYAMSVIVSRALPDVRDGLKPSQRRVLFTMSELGLNPRSSHKKSARVVGECMGKYHPHGDDPIYGTLVRLAQPFASRYPLADGHGNFGAIDGSTPAAMRYTEVRMAPPAVDMVEDLDRETVDMRPNFDESLQEPTVLPARFPNLLCNGSQGIAVGMATSIPPHNLSEVTDALIALIDNPQIKDEAILKKVPGPDFPTGGILCGTQAIRQAYMTGRGNLTIRGVVEIEDKDNKPAITITELPYQVTTEMLKEKILETIQSDKINGIANMADRSGKDGPKIILFLKKGEDPNVVLNQLYKFTPLQSSFSVNLLALDRNRPRTFTLKEMLASFRDHRFEVIRKRTVHLRRKAKEKLHLLEGLRKALDKIDAVVQTIRSSADTEIAREALKKLLQVSDKQAQNILDMKLARLTSLEQKKIDEEIAQLRSEIADYDDILKRPERVFGIMKAELLDMKKKYGDERRTRIEAAEADDIQIEDLIPDEQVIVTVSQASYVKRLPIDTYRSQHRGGKGITGAAPKDGDFIKQMFQASTHDYCLAFTNQGRVFWLKVYSIPEMARTARGRALQNLILLLPNENVTGVLPITGEFDEKREVVMATALGVIKKTNLSLFGNPLKKGVVALKLDEGDQLIGARLTDGSREIVLATRNGQAIRFHENTVRSMGRAARGVKGMTLVGDDRVVSLLVLGEEGNSILTVCERGYGKRTAVDDYRVTNRGGKGIINIRTTDRNGKVVEAVAVTKDDGAILITSEGKLIRTNCSDISEIGRATQGVKLIRLDSESDRVVAVAKVVKGEEVGEASTPLEAASAADAAASAAPPEPEETDEPPADEGEASD